MFEFELIIERGGERVHAGFRKMRHKPQAGDKIVLKTNNDDLDTYEVIGCELFAHENEGESLLGFLDDEDDRPDTVIVRLVKHSD